MCNKHMRKFNISKKKKKTKIIQIHMHAKSLQSCPTLCGPMDYSPPGISVHGILQTRILEWVGCQALLQGIFLTQGSNSCFLYLLHWQAGSLPLAPPEKLIYIYIYILNIIFHLSKSHESFCNVNTQCLQMFKAATI